MHKPSGKSDYKDLFYIVHAIIYIFILKLCIHYSVHARRLQYVCVPFGHILWDILIQGNIFSMLRVWMKQSIKIGFLTMA